MSGRDVDDLGEMELEARCMRAAMSPEQLDLARAFREYESQTAVSYLVAVTVNRTLRAKDWIKKNPFIYLGKTYDCA